MLSILLAASLMMVPSELRDWYTHLSGGSWTRSVEAVDGISSADEGNSSAAAALTISLIFDEEEGTDQLTTFQEAPFDSLSWLSWAASGLLCLEQGFLSRAEGELETAIALEPDSPLSWFILGMLREEQDNTVSAEACYGRSHSLDPSFVPAGIRYARLSALGGDSALAATVLEEVMSPSSPAGRIAFAEYILRSQPSGSDSLETLLLQADADSWLLLARDALEGDPGLALEALMRELQNPDGGGSTEMSLMLLELGELDLAESVSREALAATGDSVQTLSVLGMTLFEAGEYDESRDVFRSILEMNPFSINSLNYMGMIAEHNARTARAVDYYIMALEVDPFDPMARERLRIIAGDSYDPFQMAESMTGLSSRASMDLSIEHGNRTLVEYGGSATLSYVFHSRGTSVEAQLGGRTVRWEEDNGRRIDTLSIETGWASAVFDYWLDENYYVEASSYWDRQINTYRPWQISSHLAAGYQSYVSDWMWFSPEMGFGSVNTKWEDEDGPRYTDDVTFYASAGLLYRKPYTFIRNAQLSGSIQFPPESPERFMSSGYISVALRTWSPLFVSLRYSVDYTREPEVSTWEKFNSSFSLSLNFDLI